MLKLTEDVVKRLNIMVIGDVMLDRYIDGNVTRISPEDPTCLVLKQVDQHYQLGGAANVARNLSSLGANVVLVGFGGSKSQNEKFRAVMRDDKVVANVRDVLLDDGGRFTIKTRYRAHGRQLLRLDYEDAMEASPPVVKDLIETVLHELTNTDFNCAVLSDYSKGVLSDPVLPELTALLSSMGVPYVVDPKRPDLEAYGRPLVVCPNSKEWWAVRRSGGRSLATHTVVTRGSDGCTVMAMKHGNKTPAKMVDHSVEPVAVCDPTGAGDTFIAAMAVAMSCGQTIDQACYTANTSARLSVMEVGAHAPTLAQVLKEL